MIVRRGDDSKITQVIGHATKADLDGRRHLMGRLFMSLFLSELT